jgi:hypothetical protein
MVLAEFFIPHGHCYLWKPELVGLHLISDFLTALAYYSIPLTLTYFVTKRMDSLQDNPHPPYRNIDKKFMPMIEKLGKKQFTSLFGGNPAN